VTIKSANNKKSLQCEDINGTTQLSSSNSTNILLTFCYAEGSKDWSYPFDLCGSMYRLKDIIKLIESIILYDSMKLQPDSHPECKTETNLPKDPNCLELLGNKLFLSDSYFSKYKFGACCARPSAVIITVNKVQTSFDVPVYNTSSSPKITTEETDASNNEMLISSSIEYGLSPLPNTEISGSISLLNSYLYMIERLDSESIGAIPPRNHQIVTSQDYDLPRYLVRLPTFTSCHIGDLYYQHNNIADCDANCDIPGNTLDKNAFHSPQVGFYYDIMIMLISIVLYCLYRM
jgi:hypothetical protein